MYAIAVAAILATLVVYKLATWLWAKHLTDKALSIFPTPKGGLPFLGNALQMVVGHPWSTFTEWAKGTDGIVRINIVGTSMVYTTNPLFAKRILMNHLKYPKALTQSYKPFLALLGAGLVSAEGERWKHSRGLLSTAFRVEVLDDIPGIALRAVQRIMTRFDSAPTAVFDLNEEFQHLMLQIIAEVFVSMHPSETDAVLAPYYLPIMVECNKRVWAPWRTYLPLPAQITMRRDLYKLNSLLSGIVEKRWQDGPDPNRKKDILDRCLDNVKDFNNTVRDELRDQVKTFLLAGHETSAAMLTWALYQMIRHRDVCEEVREEHQRVFEGDRQPSLDDIKKMKWCPAILREVLRMYSVVPMVPRVAAQDDVIPPGAAGVPYEVRIPKGTVVMVHIDGIHNRPDIYPEPSEFRPSRFFDMDKVDPFAFLAFIAGPRACLGQQLALIESSIVLSYLCWNFDFELARDGDKNDGISRHDFIIPLQPSDGLHVRAKRRFGHVSCA